MTVAEIKDSTGVIVKNPALVTKLGLVYDNYKVDLLPELWLEAESKAKAKMPLLDLNTFFFQEELTHPDQPIWYSFRFYTPKENINSSP